MKVKAEEFRKAVREIAIEETMRVLGELRNFVNERILSTAEMTESTTLCEDRNVVTLVAEQYRNFIGKQVIELLSKEYGGWLNESVNEAAVAKNFDKEVLKAIGSYYKIGNPTPAKILDNYADVLGLDADDRDSLKKVREAFSRLAKSKKIHKPRGKWVPRSNESYIVGEAEWKGRGTKPGAGVPAAKKTAKKMVVQTEVKELAAVFSKMAKKDKSKE